MRRSSCDNSADPKEKTVVSKKFIRVYFCFCVYICEKERQRMRMDEIENQSLTLGHSTFWLICIKFHDFSWEWILHIFIRFFYSCKEEIWQEGKKSQFTFGLPEDWWIDLDIYKIVVQIQMYYVGFAWRYCEKIVCLFCFLFKRNIEFYIE